MDLIRNSNSQFHKSVRKPENAPSTMSSKHSEENSSHNPVDISTNNVTDTNVDVEVKATEKVIACIDKKNDNNLSKDSITNNDCIKKEEKHETTLADRESKCDIHAINVRILERLRINNIIKINGNRTTDLNKGKNNENKHNNKQTQDVEIELINNNNTEVMSVEVRSSPSFVSQIGSNTNKNFANNNTSNVVLDSGIVNGENVAEPNEVIKTVHSVPTKNSNNNSEMQNMKDQTTKCLKEFDDILAEVLGKCDSKLDDTESRSLDEIDDFLYGELKYLDCTSNFQEFKCPTDSIGSNKEDKFVNDSNNTVARYILETVMTRLHSEIASKITINDTNVVSIISDDALSANDKESEPSELTKNKLEQKDIKETEQSKNSEVTQIDNNPKDTHYIETISLSSEDEIYKDTISIRSGGEKPGSDDDCGYNSSDFEFISEEEAKVDGLKIDFNSLSSLVLECNASDFDGFQNDLHGPGPSSRNTETRDYNNRDKKVTTEKSDMEHYVVPQEHEFLDMFQCVPLHELHILENKSVRTRAPMFIQYEGIGFDKNLFAMQRGESSNDEYKDEAEETRKKIFNMYPGDNTKRKRSRY